MTFMTLNGPCHNPCFPNLFNRH